MGNLHASLQISIVILSLAVAGTASADKAAKKKAEGTLSGQIKAANEACKTTFTAKVAWASFNAHSLTWSQNAG